VGILPFCQNCYASMPLCFQMLEAMTQILGWGRDLRFV